MSNEFKINNGVEVVGSIEIGSGTTTNAVIQRRQTPAVSSSGGATIHSTIFGAGTGISNVSPYTMIDDNGATIELRAGAPASDQYGGGILITANGNTSPLGDGNAIVFRNRTGVDTYTERMRIVADGNVGIGSTTPNSKLTVVTTAGTYGLNVSDGDSSDFVIVPGVDTGVVRVGPEKGDMAFYTQNVERIRIDMDGNVVIGSTTPNSKLTVVTTAGTYGLNVSDESTSDFIVVPGVSSGVVRVGPGTGEMAIYANGSEAIRIDLDNNVGIGTNNPSVKFHLDGTIQIDNQTGGVPSSGPVAIISPTLDGYYGGAVSSGSDYLSEPATWLTIKLDGSTYYIPAYS
jgi:hypothetical protein